MMISVPMTYIFQQIWNLSLLHLPSGHLGSLTVSLHLSVTASQMSFRQDTLQCPIFLLRPLLIFHLCIVDHRLQCQKTVPPTLAVPMVMDVM